MLTKPTNAAIIHTTWFAGGQFSTLGKLSMQCTAYEQPWSCTTRAIQMILQVNENVHLAIAIDSALADSTFMHVPENMACCMSQESACKWMGS